MLFILQAEFGLTPAGRYNLEWAYFTYTHTPPIPLLYLCNLIGPYPLGMLLQKVACPIIAYGEANKSIVDRPEADPERGFTEISLFKGLTEDLYEARQSEGCIRLSQ